MNIVDIIRGLLAAYKSGSKIEAVNILLDLADDWAKTQPVTPLTLFYVSLIDTIRKGLVLVPAQALYAAVAPVAGSALTSDEIMDLEAELASCGDEPAQMDLKKVLPILLKLAKWVLLFV